MNEKVESLKRAVAFGIDNGKKNLIVDLDVLNSLLNTHAPLNSNCPKVILMMLEGIADQAAKEQFFNTLHRTNELEKELLIRLQQTVNRG